MLQAFFGVLREEDVLRGQVLFSRLEEMTLFLEVPAEAGQPFRLGFLGLSLLLVRRDERLRRHENDDQSGDFAGKEAVGLAHGAYCIGCCWLLMALLFVGGVMSLPWVAALAVIVLIEKVAPIGERGALAVGFVAIGAGLFMLLS